MAPSPPPTAITLKVKVPPGYIEGGVDEYNLGSLQVSSTIGAVRQQIQGLVPSHPAPEKQRLLYGGRALVDNEQTLADALNTKRDTEQGEYVIHLLVKAEQQNSTTPGAGASHRRVASTPQPQMQQQQPGQPAPPQGVPPAHVQLHQQYMAEQLRQQQQLIQQMAQRNGGVLPGMPHAQHMHVPPGLPMQPNFTQLIAQQQQQRAAMGMQGAGPQPQQNVAPQNGAAQPTTTPGQEQGQQQPNAPSQQPQPPTANGQAGIPQHGQQPQQGVHRPVSGQGFHFEGIGPNGQRVQIHQQTLQIPHAGIPGQPQPLFGMPPMVPGFAAQQQGFGQPGGLFGQPPAPGIFGHAQQQQQGQVQPTGPSALERARDNLAEMRRMLDEMRDTNGVTEEQRTRIANMQERTQSVNDYVDPFGVAGGLFGNAGRRSASPNTAAQGLPQLPQRSLFGSTPTVPGQPRPTGFGNSQPLFGNQPQIAQQQQQQPSNDVTCYLLSGPQGPQALLFSPQHGTYTGQLANNAATTLRPTPTTQMASITGQPEQPRRAHGMLEQAPAADPVAAAAAQHVADGAARQAAAGGGGQAQAQAQDPAGPMAGLVNHMWLLLRVLIFAYFLLGSNMGWKRPLALLVIGFGFWMVRAGLFGDGGILRRWWDGIVHIPGRQQPNEQPQAQAGGQQGGDAQAARAMPTPEQVAQRLVNERNQQNNARFQQVRELVRPVERAIALFVASLWPGIGEAHVHAREQEERRRNEEEIAERRRQEEAREAESKESSASGEQPSSTEADAGAASSADAEKSAGEGEKTEAEAGSV